MKQTFSCLSRLSSYTAGVFKRPPFEVFPVAPAGYVAFFALLTGRLYLVAFETFCFACNTA